MNTFVKEQQGLWEYLQTAKIPVVIYGMGDGAVKILDVCRDYGIKVSDIFASDEYVRGHSFLGYNVKKLSQIERQYDDFIILLAFAVFTDELVGKIYELAKKHKVFAPDVPVIGDGLFTLDYYKANLDSFNEVYHMLADDQSKKVYRNIINFKISGKLNYLKAAVSPKQNDFKDILKLSASESYGDLGAYDGDTILEFLDYAHAYNSIIALEPDAKNFKKLTKTIERHGLKNVTCYNIGSFSEEKTLLFSSKAGRNSALSQSGNIEIPVNSLDNILGGSPISYIKMDVEGAELETLKGAAQSIKQYMPKLNVSAYHRNEDLFAIPLYIKSLCSDYKIYIRHHQYIPAWETIVYGVK